MTLCNSHGPTSFELSSSKLGCDTQPTQWSGRGRRMGLPHALNKSADLWFWKQNHNKMSIPHGSKQGNVLSRSFCRCWISVHQKSLPVGRAVLRACCIFHFSGQIPTHQHWKTMRLFFARNECYSWEFARCIIFWPCLFYGWVFSRFFPYHCCFWRFQVGVSVVGHFLTLQCNYITFQECLDKPIRQYPQNSAYLRPAESPQPKGVASSSFAGSSFTFLGQKIHQASVSVHRFETHPSHVFRRHANIPTAHNNYLQKGICRQRTARLPPGRSD